MDPVSIGTTGWTIAKTAGEISKKLYEFGRSIKDREQKQRIDEFVDEIRELKQTASELEDENRELREKLRFKSDDFEFRNPFWFEKKHPDRPLCAKCFASQNIAPMSEAYEASGVYRQCLVCANYVEVERGR